jgi:hypothetical protein
VNHYNNVRLNSATCYITPKGMLAGRQQEIHAERGRKLEETRKQRQIRRQQREGTKRPISGKHTVEKLPRPESCRSVNIAAITEDEALRIQGRHSAKCGPPHELGKPSSTIQRSTIGLGDSTPAFAAMVSRSCRDSGGLPFE